MKTFLALFLFFGLVACEPDDKKDPPSEPPEVSQPSPTTPTPTDPPTTPPTVPGGEPPITEPPVITDPSPQEPPEPSPEVPPDRADTFSFNVTFGGTSSYNTEARRTRYRNAVKTCDRIVASQAFRDRILAHEYNGSLGFASSSRSPAYVYNHILDGNETLQNTKDNQLDVEVRFYREDNNVVGWTNGSIKYINVNVKFFDTYVDSQICANLMHEWMHKLGYGHDVSATARRPYSVPYAIGSITRSVGRTLPK